MLLAAVTPVFLSADVGEYPAQDEWFSFAVEQYGAVVPVKNNRVCLEKAPFTFVLITRGPIGVLVNFSTENIMFKGFLKNKQLADFLDRPDNFMGLGEDNMNPNERIFLNETAAHYLFYTDGATHRYSSVEKQGEYIIGRRIVSSYTAYDDVDLVTPIDRLDVDTIYLSMMYAEWNDDYSRNELQKEALKIIFSD